MMKRSCRACVLILLLMVLLVPGHVRAAAKVSVPKKITTSRMLKGSDDLEKTHVHTISYDSSGRIKKLTVSSSITDNSWEYRFSYKKSGSKTVVKSTCYDDEGTSLVGTYKFSTKGFLLSAPGGKACTYSYFDKEKTKPETLIVKKDKAIVFTNKGVPEGILSLKGSKYDGFVLLESKNGQIRDAYRFLFAKPVSDITEKLLKKSGYDYYKFSTKTAKVSMSSAAKWMNQVLMIDYIFYN